MSKKHHLLNRLEHAKNQSVLVDGTEYKIDGNGVMKDVEEKHAQKLLLNKNVWSKYNPRDPVTAPKKRSVALIDSEGNHYHPDNSATRKVLSPNPLLSDDSSKAKDIVHFQDHNASTPSVSPLQDDRLKHAISAPPDSPDQAQKDAQALEAENGDDSDTVETDELTHDGKRKRVRRAKVQQ